MLAPIFADLRFIVIDEVHAFMGSDRGRQVLCQLQRLSEYMKKQPRRVGLSATLGDYRFAEEWLQSGTERPVITPRISVGQQRARLAVEHFIVPAAAGTEQLGTEQLGTEQLRNRAALSITRTRESASVLRIHL